MNGEIFKTSLEVMLGGMSVIFFQLPTSIWLQLTKRWRQSTPYSVGGFIAETSGLQHDQLKNLIFEKIKRKDIINKVFKRCK